MPRIRIVRFSHCAIREYGNGTTIGEWMNRLGRSSRKPLVPRRQLRRRLHHARQIAQARRPHAGVLDEQHAVPARGEPRS